ncbi:hypothetical protein [Sagittula sp. SSi028]|uniref:hypothetical protein n=1 Tax=Sagittula sp. SSi028 TaxID=3400636 RepID=UPI003AF94A1E
MQLEQTLTKLDVGVLPPDQARDLGQMGYMQWLGALPACADYLAEARRARAVARPLAPASPAVAVFCRLLSLSIQQPLRPLPMVKTAPKRRGGARARRLQL